jgi:hypothetical protein
VLGYLVPVTVLFLLPVARLLHHRVRAVRRAGAAVAGALLVATVVVNVQRFVAAPGILPASFARHHPDLWISQARYQAPYADTAATIRAADRTDAAVADLRRVVDPATDVVVCVSAEGGGALYRTIDEVLPDVRVALVDPFTSQEHGGLAYPHHGGVLAVGPGGHAFFLVRSRAPQLPALASRRLAARTATLPAGWTLWRVAPGATVFGVTVTAPGGPR